MDLILRHANLPDGRRDVDIAVRDGRIAAVAPQLDAKGAQEIDVAGRLVSPPFVDAHFHMDATLSLGLPRRNRSGTLLEGIALWGELKPDLTQQAVVDRALAYCDMAVAERNRPSCGNATSCRSRYGATRRFTSTSASTASRRSSQMSTWLRIASRPCATAMSQ
ncbi:MAG TPA: amidohydrolase family protein [Tahibacter sp.]|nr:amidohydrolase family protein [Tahibacter sp.]